MAETTEPLAPRGELLRIDPSTGALQARSYRATVLSGPDAGRSVDIERPLLVGSRAEGGFVLNDPAVSGHHLELVPRGEGLSLRDLGSTNGTFIGGARVQELLVEREAVVQVGRTMLQLSVSETEIEPLRGPDHFGAALGQSARMRALFGLLERVAPTDSTVVLLGETGTGKEILAEALHQRSLRRERPFVVFDCAAVAPALVESELFGHVRGAFTGAVSERKGAFLEADGGTLFLDEIGELPLELQPRLLRALESGTIKRLGEDKPRRVNVRIVAATHRNLAAEVEAGRFRRDLYFRLAVVPAQVPPLRERPEDIPALTRHFIQALGRGDFALSEVLLARFANYRWPGNVRELRNLVERALVESLAELPEEPVAEAGPRDDLTGLPFKEAKQRLVDAFTREYLEALLERCGGNVSQMSRTAGIARNHLRELLNRFALKATDG